MENQYCEDTKYCAKTEAPILLQSRASGGAGRAAVVQAKKSMPAATLPPYPPSAPQRRPSHAPSPRPPTAQANVHWPTHGQPTTGANSIGVQLCLFCTPHRHFGAVGVQIGPICTRSPSGDMVVRYKYATIITIFAH